MTIMFDHVAFLSLHEGKKGKRKREEKFRQALMFSWSEALIHLSFNQIYNSILLSTVAVQYSSH